MPTRSGKNLLGFIDPISVIGVLFLVITLAIGTAVTTNKDFSLNIVEKAANNSNTGNSCFDNCRKNKGTQFCNKQCGLNITVTGEDKTVYQIPAPITQQTSQQSSSCTALCLKNATPDECGCDGNTTGLGIIPNSGSSGSNANTNNDSNTTNDYVGTIPSLISYAEGCKNLKCAIDERCTQNTSGTWACNKITIVDNTTTTNNNATDAIEQQRLTNSIQKDPNYNINIDKCGGSGWDMIWQNNTCVMSEAKRVTVEKQLTEAKATRDKQVNTTDEIIAKTEAVVESIKNPAQYANCNGNEECNRGLAVLDTIVSDSYINYWQEQNANAVPGATIADIAFNQKTVLDTLDYIALNDKKVTNYVSNYQRINEQTYSNPNATYWDAVVAGAKDKETLASTIDLGVTLTAEVYALTVAAPLALTSGGIVPGALSLMGQAQVVSTAMQGGGTATYCVLNGLDENCQQQIARTGISVATIGVSQYANTFGNALGRVANTVTTASNFAVDTTDAVVAFSDPNADALIKAMSLIAVVGDIGGGVMDFNQHQLGITKADLTTIKTDLNKLVTTDSPGFQLGQVENIPKWNPLTATIDQKDIPLVEIPDTPKVVAGADLPIVKPADVPVVERITDWKDRLFTDAPITTPPSLLAKMKTQVIDFLTKDILPINTLLENGNNDLPDGLNWNEPNGFTQINSNKISAINSFNYQDAGGQGMTVEKFREILREDGKFDEYLYKNDPIIGYELPDGTIYITTGRHKAIAAIEEGYTKLPIELYRLQNQSKVEYLIGEIKDNLLPLFTKN